MSDFNGGNGGHRGGGFFITGLVCFFLALALLMWLLLT